MTTSTPSTPTPHGRRITSIKFVPFHPDQWQEGNQSIPVSTAIRASSIWHLMCVRILAFNPSLQIASQSLRDCSDATGEVSSRYSTPKASNALAMAILVLVSKKALANCSPSVFERENNSERLTRMTRPTEKQTSERAFYNFEVGDIVEEIGGSGSIGVSVLGVTGRRTVCPAGLDGGWGHDEGLEEMLMPQPKT